jgi:hypothetical protein
MVQSLYQINDEYAYEFEERGKMKVTLDIDISGLNDKIDFKVNRLLCAGWSGRDSSEVMKHAEELRHLGIDPPEDFPIIFPVSRYLLTMDKEIEVISSETSGEVEYVVFYNNREECYLTVGSDHTDRALEGFSIEKSKQSCPKIISEKAWLYQDVKDHWDELILQSYVDQNGEKTLYQEAQLKSILNLESLLSHVDKERFGETGLVIFSGTTPLLTGNIIYSNTFKFVMTDPVLERKLSNQYNVTIL